MVHDRQAATSENEKIDMATDFDVTALFPRPQRVTFLDGATEMCSDVRLATSNVLPFMRKTMRTVFSGANIRIVANKKKFVIHVNIVPESELDFADAPVELRNDFYRMTVLDNVVTIRAASQIGAVWGTQTFANLYKASGHDAHVPNMEIADWADLPMRGIFLPADDVAAEMHLDEWCALLDRMGDAKLNMLVIELLGRQNLEYLMVRLNDDEEWMPDTERTFYSPVDKAWKSVPFAPVMFTEGFYADYATSASERGIQLVPALSLFANNSILPQLSPALNGRDADGNDTPGVCCFMRPDARERLEEYYGFFLDTHYPDGAGKLLLQFDRLPAAGDSDQWCQCEACRKQSPAENAADLAIWLTTMLTAKGVANVILRNSSPEHRFSVLTPDLVSRLQSANLADRVILQPAAAIDPTDTAAPLFGESSGTGGTWIGLGNAQCDCLAACPGEQTVIANTQRVRDAGAIGMANAAAADPFGRETDRVAGGAQWNTASIEDNTIDDAVTAALDSMFGPYADAYRQAWETLSATAKGSPALQACCLCGLDTADRKVKSALNRLAAIPDAAAQLETISKAAQTAVDLLRPMTQEKDKEDKLVRTADLIAGLSLRGEAVRAKAVADTFLKLLPLAEDLDKGALDQAGKEALTGARNDLLQSMQETVEFKPRYVVPAALMHLSVLLAFIDDARAL